LRDTLGSEISTKKRQTNWQTDVVQADYLEKVQEKYTLLSDFIKDRVQIIISNSWFDSTYFENLPNKIQKLLYILNILYWIEINEIKELRKKWVWARVIANYLNTNLESFFESNNISLRIFPKDVQAILNS
jgi:hypothetical protein